MKAKRLIVITLLIALVLAPITPPTHGEMLSGPATASVRATLPVASQFAATDSPQARVTESLRSSPVMFIENVGQFDDSARFQVRGGDKTIWLAEDGLWVTVAETPSQPSPASESEPHPAPRLPDGRRSSSLSVAETEEEPGVSGEVRRVNIRLSLPGANPHPRLEPFNRLETVVSYFIGNDPAQWRVAVPVWGGVRYRDLYPGIDLEITGAGGHLVQRLVARPGADLAAVRLKVEGADAVTPTAATLSSADVGGEAAWGQGNRGESLLLRTALGDFTLPLLQVEGEQVKPATVQQVDSLAFEVAYPFTAGNGAVSTPLSATHPQQTVSLLYAGFLGGSGSDRGYGIAVDAAGNAYVTGYTDSGDFPTVAEPDTSYNGGGYKDAFVVKVNPSGTALLYAGFLGGSNGETGNGIAVDAAGNAYVTGYTYSSDFPTNAGPYTSHNGDTDAFVVKVGAGGGGGTEPFSSVIIPIWPPDHTTVSPVMRGGTAYRYFRLLDSGDNPIPNAIVRFSTGSPTITDEQGYFTYTILADALGNLGRYSISIQSITVGGQTYPTNNQPTFSVEVREREYAHSWRYGAMRSASIGISTGLIAYVSGETNGGLGLTLQESDPNSTNDDRVEMKQNYSSEVNTGVGLGMRVPINAVVVKSNLEASATTEMKMRGFGSLKAEFAQPYADNDRKSQGIFLTLSVLDSAVGFPSQPMIVNMLRVVEERFPYLSYISAQSAGMAVGVTPKTNIGAEVNLAASRSGSQRKEMTVGFTLLDANASYMVVAMLTDYGDEYSAGFEESVSANLTLLTPNLPLIRNRLTGLIGNVSSRLYKEYFFDSATNRLKRIELTIIGEGNPNVFTDVTKRQVSVRMVLEGENLTPSLRSQIGRAQSLSELNALLSAVPRIPYSVEVEDGASLSVVPEIGIPGTEIKLGAGLEVEKTRNLIWERGVFLNGIPYITEKYNADSYVSRPGKSWTDLSANALGGLWLLVRDAYNWVGKQIVSGANWVIDTVSRKAGALWGGVRLFASPRTQLYLQNPGGQGVAIQQTDPITVTAIGWVPETTAGTGVLNLNPALTTSSGEGFVVGGIYEFQPYNLTLDPAATLVITYTNEAALGIDESRIGMFRWNPASNNWQPIPAIADTTNNVFTATITQLGTFALGYDATPPQISVSAPMNGSTITNTLPLISALVVDTGVGIDPATVEMQLDGQVVAATYITGTGELMYMPPTSLSVGQHTVTVSARDVVGNQASATISFSIESSQQYVYIPLIRR